MTRAARLPIALAAASCGGLLAGSSAPAAPPATVPEAPASALADPLDRLDQLDQLRRRGAITGEEFERKKAELLDRL